MALDRFETGNSIQFTFVSSVAPDAAPVLKITGLSDTVVASITATQSDTTHFYSLYTMPNSEGMYLGEWYAEKTFSGSARAFRERFLFIVGATKRES